MIKTVDSVIFYLIFANWFCISVYSYENYQSSDKQNSLRRNIKPVNLVNWQWNCDGHQSKCRRFHSKIHANDSFHYLEGCKSVCGTYGSIWPQPTGESVIKHDLKAFNIEDLAVKFDPKESDQLLDEALTGEYFYSKSSWDYRLSWFLTQTYISKVDSKAIFLDFIFNKNYIHASSNVKKNI